MNHRHISITTVIISGVFTAAVIFLAAGIADDYKKGLVNAKAYFDRLSARTVTIISHTPVESPKFAADLCSESVLTDNIAAITIKYNGQNFLEYPSQDSNTIFSSPLVNTYSTQIGTAGSNIILTAAIYTLSPSAIFSRTRITFIIILTGTLAASLLLGYLYLSERICAEGTSGTNIKMNVVQQNQQPDETDPVVKAVAEGQSALSQVNDTTEPEHDKTLPEGLFSPVSGVGWESYLLTRLESELIRAASSEQDLSLFIIRIPGFNRDTEISREIGHYLIDQFIFTDMLFEYKKDGFAAIKLNESLDTAIEMAENIHAGLTAILRKKNIGLAASIGISSRSVRIISGERLISEANRAADHAIEDTASAVVAFKVNPEKYRKYISDFSGNKS